MKIAINDIKPDNSQHWIVNKNILYVDYYYKIPVCHIENDVIWVYFDTKIYKYVLKVVKRLMNINKTFFFRCPSNYKIDEKFHLKNLESYLFHFMNENFFNGFEKLEFDYVGNITMYLKKYKLFQEFKIVYDKHNEKSKQKYYDFYGNNYYYAVKNERIRNMISSLEREIKISILL